jgi:hypothetical protein
MAERPHRHDNSRAGEPASRWNNSITASSSGPRCHVASGTPAAQQSTFDWSITLSSRAVASRCRPAHHRRHEHATPGGVVPTICTAVALSISSAYAIHGVGATGGARCAPTSAAPCADGQLADNRPQGGDQPPSRWGGQSHHHRAQLRDASRHRGSQPRERLQPACTSGCAPSFTCASPPWLPASFGGVHGIGPTPTYGTTGWSTLLSSCRSTPPPSSRQGAMRLPWPTTSP